MDEFDGLIEKICNASSPAPVRAAAESRLMEILSNSSSWKPYANLLYQANDTVCFFICIGFQRMAWRHWRTISMEDRLMLNQTIVQTLSTRPSMQPFAKSKLEQVLATICANSCSLEPALGLLVDAGHPNVNTGLSAMRTVLELILSEDPQLFPEHRAPLNSAVNDIVLPLTNLACSACNAAINGTSEAKEQNSHTVTVSLELLKVLISKLQIGPHVTRDVIDLLFSVAELGASGAQCNINAEDLRRAALSSIEILTEIMSKRYLPLTTRANTDPSASNSIGVGTTANAGGAGNNNASASSGSLGILMDIVVKTVSLLKKIRMSGNIGESAVAVSLLEFISVFSESHLERCISLSTMQTNNTSIGSGGNIGSNIGSSNIGSSSVDQNMNTTVLMFFEELVAITTCTMEPEILSKIVCVWNRVLALGSVKDTLLLQTPLCLSIVSHLLQSCLLQTNVYLADNSDELVEDLAVDTVVDPHIRNVLSHICDYTTNAVEGAEEVNYVGTVLLADTATLFGELVSCADVQQWLSSSVSQLVVQDIPRIGSTNVAVDLHFLVRLLPLLSSNVMQLVSQLCGLLGQLVDSQMHTRGREYVALELVCCQLVGQLLQSGRAVPNISAVTADTIANMQNVFALLIAAATRVCNDVPVSNSVSVVPVATAVSALLLQAVTVYVDILELDNSQCASLRQGIIDTLQAIMVHVPIEVVTLHVCAQDLLQPHGVAQVMVAQCVELVGVIEQSAASNYATLDGQTIERLTKVTAALDGLARNHSLSKPQRRQLLVSHYTPLQQFMGKFASVLFRLLLHTYSTEYANSGTSNTNTSGSGSSGAGVNSSAVCYEVRLVVSLSCALLQSLGKKSFGKAAADVLNISVDFAENINAIQLPSVNGGGGSSGGGSLSKLLFERSGLQLTKQLLELSQVLAESTAAASPSVNNQASSTHRLLCFVAVGLNDDRICAELLQPTLKAGITAVRCYWQKTQRSLPFLASINQNQAQQEQLIMHSPNGGAAYPDINGENVRPIAVLLTQLCVGSLSPNVPPQDTLTALEGLIMLSEQHKLFAMNWFQNQCFGSLLTPVLKAVLLRIHNNHRPTLESLLIALASAGESSYLAMAQSELANQQHHQQQNQQLGSPLQLQRGASGSGSDSPHTTSNNRDVGEAMYAKYQEFWVTIGSEMIGIAAQYRSGEMASHTLYSVLNSYQAAAVAAGQYSAGISSISANSSSRGPFLVDMRIFIDKIINPVSSEIARLN